MEKRIQVLKHPATWIVCDTTVDPSLAAVRWLDKHHMQSKRLSRAYTPSEEQQKYFRTRWIESKVGAKSVSCGCPVCNSCLLLYEILYIGGSEIYQEQAIKENLVCVKCGCLLAENRKMFRTKLTT